MDQKILSWWVLILGILSIIGVYIVGLKQVFFIAPIITSILGIILLITKKDNLLIKSGSWFLIISPVLALLIIFLSQGIGNGTLLIPYISGMAYLLGFVLVVVGLFKKNT